MHFFFIAVAIWLVAYVAYKAVRPEPPRPPIIPDQKERSRHTLELHETVLELREGIRDTKIAQNLLAGVERNGNDIRAQTIALAGDDPFSQALARNNAMAPPEPQADGHDGAPPVTATIIPLKPDEPQNLEEYRGQDNIIRQLELQLMAMRPEQRVLKHMLLTGLPGFGKTLLAKLVGRRLQERAAELKLGEIGFVETYGANLNSVAALDQIAEQLLQHKAVVWFIDEIHVMNMDMATKIYLLMEEGRYPFSGSTKPTELPPIMVIGATTDYGSLHPALKRRFGEPFMMRPLDYDTLVNLALNLVPKLTLKGAQAIADRCKQSGAPHEVRALCEAVKTWGQATNATWLSEREVDTVMHTLDIDHNGLRSIDRKVLQVMENMPRRRVRDQEIIAYGGSEADVCAMAGIDRQEFQRVVRPRLMSRGLISVRAGIGIALTEDPPQ